MVAPKVLGEEFYAQDTVTVARGLLGKLFLYHHPAGLTGGRIVETEAYLGAGDPACHAARGQTARNAVMFGPPGRAYIYQIYGMYFCLNIVTEPEGIPAAVLVRALEPLYGVELMQQNCPRREQRDLCRGPARLVQALGLTKELNGVSVVTGPLRVLDDAPAALPGEIIATTRVGINQGHELPLRFYLAENPYISRK